MLCPCACTASLTDVSCGGGKQRCHIRVPLQTPLVPFAPPPPRRLINRRLLGTRLEVEQAK